MAVKIEKAPTDEAALLQLAAKEISEPLMLSLNLENFLQEFL